jgi:hypothetical protein
VAPRREWRPERGERSDAESDCWPLPRPVGLGPACRPRPGLSASARPVGLSACDLSHILYKSMSGVYFTEVRSGGQLSYSLEGGKTIINGLSACPTLPADGLLDAFTQMDFGDDKCVLGLKPIDTLSDIFPTCTSAGDGTCTLSIGDMLNHPWTS